MAESYYCKAKSVSKACLTTTNLTAEVPENFGDMDKRQMLELICAFLPITAFIKEVQLLF